MASLNLKNMHVNGKKGYFSKIPIRKHHEHKKTVLQPRTQYIFILNNTQKKTSQNITATTETKTTQNSLIVNKCEIVNLYKTSLKIATKRGHKTSCCHLI